VVGFPAPATFNFPAGEKFIIKPMKRKRIPEVEKKAGVETRMVLEAMGTCDLRFFGAGKD